MFRLKKIIITIQGIYYSLIGLWGVINIQSFVNFTHYSSDFFLQQIIATVILGLGLLYLDFAQSPFISKSRLAITIFIAFLIAFFEFLALGTIGGSHLKYDMLEEIIFAVVGLVALFHRPQPQKEPSLA